MLESLAFETVELFSHCTDLTEVKTVFGQACEGFGAKAFVICDIPPGTPVGKQDAHALGWAPDWEKTYLQNRYAVDDPIPNYVNRTANPYYWQEAAQHLSRSNRKAQEVMDVAKHDFGLVSGYCVPIHGLSGIAGLVSVAAEIPDWNLSEREDAALHLICIYAYEAVRKLRTKGIIGGAPKLSPRELECIRWLAEGKTTWEIGGILGISEETIKQYIKSAARKFGTCTRAHLVARAFQLKIMR